VLATGGTSAGAQASATDYGYQSGAYDVKTLLAAVPNVSDLAAITGEQVANIGSQDMNDAIWLELAKRLAQVLASADTGAVSITHGTDTLEETSYLLSLVAKSPKPVVMVGSMRPATATSADSPANIYNGVAVAVDPGARGRGVLVSLDDEIHYARNVVKTNTRVDIVYAHANMSADLIDAAVANGAKGIVVAGVGDGNMTTPALDALKRAIQKGVAVVRSTRLPSGRVLRNNEVNDDELGTIASDELDPPKSRVLLQLALTKTQDPNEIQHMFHEY
jgi:L-asparaginase